MWFVSVETECCRRRPDLNPESLKADVTQSIRSGLAASKADAAPSRLACARRRCRKESEVHLYKHLPVYTSTCSLIQFIELSSRICTPLPSTTHTSTPPPPSWTSPNRKQRSPRTVRTTMQTTMQTTATRKTRRNRHHTLHHPSYYTAHPRS